MSRAAEVPTMDVITLLPGFRRQVAAELLVLSGIALAVTACGPGFAPVGPPAATDFGAMGCQIAPLPGATVREGEPLAAGEPMEGVPVTTLSPREVGEIARARGLKVTWRYAYDFADDPTTGFAECWCEPPPGGRVTDVAYGMASELVVFVQAEERIGSPRPQPPWGWGCR
jgi:hypothetical protein